VTQVIDEVGLQAPTEFVIGAHLQTASFDPGRRFHFFEHVVQFFKPNGATFFSAILGIAHYACGFKNVQALP
jgi:hypothetical protein